MNLLKFLFFSALSNNICIIKPNKPRLRVKAALVSIVTWCWGKERFTQDLKQSDNQQPHRTCCKIHHRFSIVSSMMHNSFTVFSQFYTNVLSHIKPASVSVRLFHLYSKQILSKEREKGVRETTQVFQKPRQEMTGRSHMKDFLVLLL